MHCEHFRRRTQLPALFDQPIDGEATVLIARGTYCKPWGDLILALDDLALRRSDVAREGYEEVSGDALLDSDVGSGRALVAASGEDGAGGGLGETGGLGGT